MRYLPPESALLGRLAEQTCATLEQRHGASFNDPEVVTGLTEFLSTVAQLTAKVLTHHQAIGLKSQPSGRLMQVQEGTA